MVCRRRCLRPSRHLRRAKRHNFLRSELLESRDLMTATPNDAEGDLPLNSGDGICSCPICSGQNLESYLAESGTTSGSGTTSTSTTNPLSAIPALSSLAGSAYTLHLDFDGHSTGTWGAFANVTTPVYDSDGDPTTFSAAELNAIREIWARVAEDYAPFNINVTTVDPGNLTNGRTLKVAIGGTYSDWFGSSAGGVAYINSFTNSIPNVAFVFAKNLGNGMARYVAEAASHEAGHAFGLLHHSTYSGSTKTAEYDQGNSQWAPIMGVGYYSSVTTWYNGPNSNGSTSLQDDMAIIAGATNGFGYRADDHGNSTSSASALLRSGNNLSGAGIVGRNNDVDYFSFTTAGGSVSFTINVAAVGANLDAVVELRSATGTIIASANPSTSLHATVSASVAAGAYYLSVHSTGTYGFVGQYTVTGAAPASSSTTTAAPEITVLQGTTNLTSGSGSVNFGTTTVGSAVTKTFTVRNDGAAQLTLTQLSSSNLPAGFTLVSGLGSTSLAAGASTTFTVRMSATSAGTFSGALTLRSNDSNESSFRIALTGSVAAPLVRIIDNGATGFSKSGSWATLSTGRDRDANRAAAGTGSISATWNFTNLPAGTYKVSATWIQASNYATNAPFTISGDGRVLRSVAVNQRLAPSGATLNNSRWQDLGTVTITGTTLSVRLTNAANGFVLADAIRIERIGTSSSPAVAASVAEFGLARMTATHGSNVSRLASGNHVAEAEGLNVNESALDSNVGDLDNHASPLESKSEVATFASATADTSFTAFLPIAGQSNSLHFTPIASATSTEMLLEALDSQLDALDELVAALEQAWA